MLVSPGTELLTRAVGVVQSVVVACGQFCPEGSVPLNTARHDDPEGATTADFQFGDELPPFVT